MQITNAYQNNLKNLSLEIPENKLIVLTGLSGSGKSSLAMGVIGNEGYRYFLESLPAYNQQNANLIPTAEVDDIKDLPPVIKVEQSKRFQSINTTFGTLSEITSIFRILFARYSANKPMSKSLFSFNHPKGACQTCRGIGEAEYIDIEKLVGDENKTLREGAITTTLPGGYIVYSQITVEELDKVCHAHGFSVDIPWKELSDEQKDVVLNGSDRLKVFYGKHTLESRLRWEGFKAKPREEGYYKGMLPIMQDILKRDRNKNILRFASSSLCPACHGARIKPDHLKFKWQDRNFAEWMDLPLAELNKILQDLNLKAGEQDLVHKIKVQLGDLVQLGMGNYCLSTPSSKISSGDAQRVKLIKQVNSNLQGILYIFDEPSIGLAENFQKHLRHILQRLIARGNTVMVVEHDLAFIRSADWIIELGPGAGIHGGEILFNGPMEEFLNSESLSTPTLEEIKASEKDAIEIVKKPTAALNINAGELTVISRMNETIEKQLQEISEEKDLKLITVSDQPIGKTPRSNPATYTGLADKIRDLLAKSQDAKTRKLAKGSFSFNNKAGRCEECEGAGVITLSMNVMGTINQVCPVCKGKRFKKQVLEVRWNGKNIADIYDLSIREAIEFFEAESKILTILRLMQDLGLDYLKLGQPSNTLSGGEAQRIKLTKHFAKPSKDNILILEEPSIGLHQRNVGQLITALHKLKEQTAGIVCIENHELFKQHADAFFNNSEDILETSIPAPEFQRTDEIRILGARTHYLKNLDLVLQKSALITVTGISGSGKSSLLIDTLHAYGMQEMTRQFSAYQQSRVGVNFQMEVEQIDGLTPSICVTRKVPNFTNRSDLAKQTGIDKLLRFAFSRKAEFEGEELSASHFSNNHELGKCQICEGLGEELLPDITKLAPDTSLSVSEGVFEHNKALSYYGQRDSQYMAILEEVGKEYGFDLSTAFEEFSEEQKMIIFEGTGEKVWAAHWKFKTKTREGIQQIRMKWEGLNNYLKQEYYKTRKNKFIENLTALFSTEICSNCLGSGLKPERLNFSIGGLSIQEIKNLDFCGIDDWMQKADNYEQIDRDLIEKIGPFLVNTIHRARQLHIDHLQLNRRSQSLSGGENQRVALITQLNSPLKGITYLLDEPSAGLSEHNIPDLIAILKELVAKGNTVIVIEHHKKIIKAATELIEIGPLAGKNGGQITFQGTPADFLKQESTHAYFKKQEEAFEFTSEEKDYIKIRHLSRYTLQRDVLEIPVGGITALSGKSGIGKTTLVKDIIIPSIRHRKPFFCKDISFPENYTNAHYFEAKKLRAHAATLLVSYLDTLKELGKIFAEDSKLKPKDFSYKTKTSQCSDCNGKGYQETSLDVTANAVETCVTCKGQRYTQEILHHTKHQMNIAEVLALDLHGFKTWLEDHKKLEKLWLVLERLQKIGLGHLRLDQPIQSLSSGEKQRLLLLNWLLQGSEDMLFILDEPSTGLHYADIDLLFGILKDLSIKNDILVIDHNQYLLEKIGVGVELK
ncbi:excinuclease ABC subunit A [Christiangramia portivictoriae]|uniref:excinuclease ABC subunit A n=1 Tax=Christiangramia portivictoriae TaxID=326069 RepID=UPI000417B260|nr:excinuclease ABC subunit A [Christiangramia portivictoriae]